MEFEEYKEEVEALAKEIFGLEPNDLSEDQIKIAYEGNETPQEFIDWYGEKYGLTGISDTGFPKL